MQWFLSLLLAASVGVNAFLYQQLLQAQDAAELPLTCKDHDGVAQEQQKGNDSVRLLEEQLERLQSSDSAAAQALRMDCFSKLPFKTIERIGQLFFASKVADFYVKGNQNTKRKWKTTKRKYLTQEGYELLSVRVTEEEKQAQQLEKRTVRTIVDRLDGAGMVLIPSLVDAERCQQLAHKVHLSIMNPDTEFSPIRHSEYRKDLPLLLEGGYLEVMQDILKLLQPALEATLGKGALLKEFSTLTTFPGAPDQDFHTDSSAFTPEDYFRQAKVYSVFLYLDHVQESTAPLEVIPGTHDKYHFVDWDKELLAHRLMEQNPAVRLAVPQGSVVVYDSLVLHRGTGNPSGLTRPTLYFSLADATKPLPNGPTYSLHPRSSDSISVEDILTGNIPAPIPEDLEHHHDDILCLQSMKKACEIVVDAPDFTPEWFFDCVMEPDHADRRPRLDTLPSYEVDATDAYFFLPLEGCTLTSRIERLAQLHIYKAGFRAFVSWGEL